MHISNYCNCCCRNDIWVFIVIYVWWYRVENHAILCKTVKINYSLLFKTKYRFSPKKLLNCLYKVKKLCYEVINSALQGVKDSDKILCTYFGNIIVQRSTTHWLWNDSSHVVAYQFIKSCPVLWFCYWPPPGEKERFSEKSVKRLNKF